jgi:hypothetical protein
MSVAAAQYDKFKRQVASEKVVWTFTEAGDYLVFPVREGEAVPFWSSQSRLQLVCKHHSKYSRYQQVSLSLTEFLALLERLRGGNISVGVNWSGERLIGYDVSVESLLTGLRHYIDRSTDQPG